MKMRSLSVGSLCLFSSFSGVPVMLMPITRRVTRLSLPFVFLFLWIGFSSADSDCPEEGYWACNAESYVGDKKDGIPHGKGKFTWNDGAWYEGEVREGKINGQ